MNVLDVVRVTLLLVALVGLFLGVVSYRWYPWHEVNRTSRVPVRRTTVETARRCVSAAFLLFVPCALGALLWFTATTTRLADAASSGAATRSLLERLALLAPWDVVVAASVGLAVLLMVVPFLLVVRDVGLVLVRRRGEPGGR